MTSFPQMQEIVREIVSDSKSAKIRALGKAGFSRSEIANFLSVRYQFVRNVLVDEERRAAPLQSVTSAPTEFHPPSAGSMKVKIDGEGRIVIPAAAREKLGLQAGDALIVSVEDGELHLLTMQAAARKAQEIIRRYIPEGVSLVDELLEDRRREANAEDRE
jgi:AbrB family looped-hinge helix DNA binding protein